ncbi:MAG: bifunctional pyr operon transcriptional regulator/uracil phosphoribosyltransferase PyrR [Eubacteriaceae bacterium]|nr:bifunctional pyr operon transcriptional regulator/uracil phosphoribosyltransferase PyrR [Eubacteriaceae bacterium]
MQFKATIMEEDEVARALKRISHQILEHHRGCENVVLLGIRSRGVPLARILRDNIASIDGVELPVGSLDITLYRDDLEHDSGDPVVNGSEVDFPVEGTHVILVDDVLYTGRTARAAMEAVMKMGRAASIELAVLVDRGHRELPIRADYVGKNVPTSGKEIVSVKISQYDGLTRVDIYENA